MYILVFLLFGLMLALIERCDINLPYLLINKLCCCTYFLIDIFKFPFQKFQGGSHINIRYRTLTFFAITDYYNHWIGLMAFLFHFTMHTHTHENLKSYTGCGCVLWNPQIINFLGLLRTINYTRSCSSWCKLVTHRFGRQGWK